MKKDDKTQPEKKLPKLNPLGGQPAKKFEVNLKFNPRRTLLWFLIALLFLPFIFSLLGGFNKGKEVPVSEVVADVKQGKVEKIDVNGSTLTVTLKDQAEPVKSRIEDRDSLRSILQEAGVDVSSVPITVADQSMSRVWLDILGTVIPLVIMAVIFLFLLRQARGAQDGIFSFGRSRAKLFSKGKQSVTFKDVGGVYEAKKELEEVVDFLKHPKKYTAMGARTPKGVLLVGPSGTGKTLLARAVAGEAGVPFFSMAGSEFMEMLVGVGASRVRDLFETAKKHSPSIIFIDEIDAIGRMRGLGAAGGHDEREQTLNQILVEMDGFNPNDNVVVVAATNRGDLLDPALTRPGRFDRRVTLDLPDIEERKRVLKIHAEGKPMDPNVNWDRLAKRTVGFSGADLENTLNESAIQAAREGRKLITWADVEEAATKVKLGPSKKRLQNELERKMTAYHEAGHALVAHMLPRTDSVHRVSIVSRGSALGYTMTPPEQDKYQRTKSELIEEIAVMMGGRETEDLIFHELTAGASSDIGQATRIARAMVVDLGMSELGPVYLGPQYENTEWGRAIFEPTRISDEVQSKVDSQIAKILEQSRKLSRSILEKYKKKLDVIADALMDKETLDGDEFEKVVGVPKVRVVPAKA
jgi:cell division protease FtsH